jgi:hypothetical protein
VILFGSMRLITVARALADSTTKRRLRPSKKIRWMDELERRNHRFKRN